MIEMQHKRNQPERVSKNTKNQKFVASVKKQQTSAVVVNSISYSRMANPGVSATQKYYQYGVR